MSLQNGIITAPVSIEDVRSCLNDTSTDVGSLCSSTKINKWSKYKPVKLSDKNTVTGQWDFSNNCWLSTASWWRGSQTIELSYAEECGYRIPCITPSSEYRSQAYYTIDDTAIPGGYTAPNNVPNGLWQYQARTIYRLSDFAGYSHNPTKPLGVHYPSTSDIPIVLTPNDSGVSFQLLVNNYADRTNGNNRAIFANDISILSGAEFCAKIDINPINGTTGTRRYYELTGGNLSDSSGNKSITILRKLLQTSTNREEYMVNIQPYLRTTDNGNIKLYSVDCESLTAANLRFILSGNGLYKMRFSTGEAMGAGTLDGMFRAGYSSTIMGIDMYPIVGDDSVVCTTSGHYLGINQLYVKAIIEDVFNLGGLDDSTQYTVDVYIEDLHEGDYLKCMIPKTRILSFTTGTNCQGYGYYGTSEQGGSGSLDTSLRFANPLNNTDRVWTVIPLITPFAGAEEAWPAGTGLNPNNDVITKFRLTAEVRGRNDIVSVPQKNGTRGDGSYKKINESYPSDNMHFWRDGYVFTIKQETVGNTIVYSVEEESTIGIGNIGLDYSEVSDNYGTTSWLTLPSEWESSTSIWKTEV